ncbi:MAG: hypothetical protein WC099_00875 [Candidatus Paceibacterota bacterium]
MNGKEGISLSLEDFIAQELGLEIVNKISEEDEEKNTRAANFYAKLGRQKNLKEGNEILGISLRDIVFKNADKISSCENEEVSEAVIKYYKEKQILLQPERNEEELESFNIVFVSVDRKIHLCISTTVIESFWFTSILEAHSPITMF